MRDRRRAASRSSGTGPLSHSREFAMSELRNWMVQVSFGGGDPAERGMLRFFYRSWRPTRLGRAWSRMFAWTSGVGLTPRILTTLLVRNRRTGALDATVLVSANYEGKRYLISMLGNGSEWVQNVRAANGEALIKRGRARKIKLTEIPPDSRAPILKAWCQVATSGRKHLPVAPSAPLTAFEAISTDYPVFRIDPV